MIKWAFPQFVEAITIIQIIIVIVIPKTISQNLISKFLGFEKSRFVIIGSVIFLAVQIPSIFLLSETLGIIGIAISLVLAETIQAVFYIISNKLFLARMK